MTLPRLASALAADPSVPFRAVVVGSGRTAPAVAAALAVVDGAHVVVAARNEERTRRAAALASGQAGADIQAAPLARDTFAEAALVVEAVIEDLSVKRRVLSTVESWLPRDALLATNTSSIAPSTLAAELVRPYAFAGLHFLHPAHLTAVVEVIPSSDTSRATLEVLTGLVARMDKREIVVAGEAAGFVWNRLQFALLREALHLLDSGVASVDDIDAAVSEGLAPRWLAGGPFACADLGGLDTFARASHELFPRLSSDERVSASLTDRATAGDSFYCWSSERLELIESLRREALAIGRQLSQKRRAATPPMERR